MEFPFASTVVARIQLQDVTTVCPVTFELYGVRQPVLDEMKARKAFVAAYRAAHPSKYTPTLTESRFALDALGERLGRVAG